MKKYEIIIKGNGVCYAPPETSDKVRSEIWGTWCDNLEDNTKFYAAIVHAESDNEAVMIALQESGTIYIEIAEPKD